MDSPTPRRVKAPTVTGAEKGKRNVGKEKANPDGRDLRA